jgi:diguanylate cyclase (GGDEF)-like protein/PAS domain S-box-containing protein
MEVMKSDIPADFIELYRRAKAHFESRQDLDENTANPDDIPLLREIQIYQIALKLQRDELRTRELDLYLQNRLIETSQAITHVGSVEMDLATQQLRWSAETYRIHDTTPDEFNPSLQDNLDYYTPESRPVIAAALKAALEEGKIFDLELEKFTVKGRKISIRTTCIPSYENGKVVKFMGIYQDITEQKLKEKLLLEKEYLLSESQRIAHIGSWSWGLSHNAVVWSDETYAIYGLNPTQFVPTRDAFFSLIHPEDRPLIVQWWNQCATGDAATELEFRIVRPDGNVRFIIGCGHLERDKANNPYRMLGTVQDITERKQTELLQKHQSRILSMMAEKASLEVLLETMARDIEYINPAMLCTILLLDEQGQRVNHCAAPSMPDFFIKAIDGEMIGLGRGSCGTAAFTGECVIVENISTHPWWSSYKALAFDAGLEACWSQPILSSEGKVLGTFAIYHHQPRLPTPADIRLIETEARLAALAIEKNKDRTRLELAASVFTHAREGIIITDALANIVDVNETFSLITGYSRAEVLGKNPRLLQSGGHPPEFYTQVWSDLKNKGFWAGEVWNKRKNGDIFAELQTISSVTDSTGKTINYVSLFTDITPLKEHQQQLEYIAHYDALTRLPNRVLLGDRLKQAIARSHRLNSSLAVFYIDLDGFKSINDNHGHDVGDQLLVTVAARWNESLREGDTLARIGGDEFIVILVDLEDIHDYEFILQRLLTSAADPITVNQQSLRVSASIGVTIYPQDGSDADQLMRHADQAMYLAKQAGKNCFHLFDVAKDVAVKTHRESLDHIRQALEEHEFVLYYQPKVNMRTGTVIGLEALIRWQHPERGLLLPAAFLPIIEDHIFSIDIGDWVINQALTQMSEWRSVGLDLSVSVNVGALQLQKGHFVKRLRLQLAAHPDVPPGNLELEILETSALEDITDIADLMHQCRQLGVHFAVDDFGTGYSSLTYLKRLPAELLKIDQSFIRDMLEDPDDLAIVKGVIGLAHAFHRRVLAEGVETIAHGQLLLAQNCELAQGYGIARPMPASDIPHWVSSWQPDPAWTKGR